MVNTWVSTLSMSCVAREQALTDARLWPGRAEAGLRLRAADLPFAASGGREARAGVEGPVVAESVSLASARKLTFGLSLTSFVDAELLDP
jgi:hypothetical protein